MRVGPGSAPTTGYQKSIAVTRYSPCSSRWMNGSSSAASNRGEKWLAPHHDREQAPGHERVREHLHRPRVEHRQDDPPPRMGRRHPQQQRHRRRQHQQRRGQRTPAACAGPCAPRTASCRTARWGTPAPGSAPPARPATPTSDSAAPGSPGAPRSRGASRPGSPSRPAGSAARPRHGTTSPVHDERDIGWPGVGAVGKGGDREPEQQEDQQDERPSGGRTAYETGHRPVS